MIEMTLLKQTKETDKKVRWDAKVDSAPFELYIPKWRVPTPWPKVIYVTIEVYNKQQPFVLSRNSARKVPDLRKKPIIARIKYFQEKVHTIRYQPEGGPFAWEIGEPYIPIPLTYDEAEYLIIKVEWQKNSN